jgi:hypothetical protein
MPSAPDDLLAELRRLSTYQHTAFDNAIRSLSDSEIYFLASQLTALAAHLTAGVGGSAGMPPPATIPGAGHVRLDLAAQPSAIDIAAMFTRYTLHRWGWADILIDAERMVRELTTAFVLTIANSPLLFPTRMTVCLRMLSERQLAVELHDATENTDVIARAEHLITADVERISVRCGRHSTDGRTVLWAQLARTGTGQMDPLTPTPRHR